MFGYDEWQPSRANHLANITYHLKKRLGASKYFLNFAENILTYEKDIIINRNGVSRAVC